MDPVHGAPVFQTLSQDSWRLSTARWGSREESSESRRSDNTHLTVPAAVIWCRKQAPALFDLPDKTHTHTRSSPKSSVFSPKKVGNWCIFGLTSIFNSNEELQKLFKGWIELADLQHKCSQTVALFNWKPHINQHLQPHLNEHSQHSKAIRFVQCHGYAGILVWIEVDYVHLEDERVQRYSGGERIAQGIMLEMSICATVWTFP